MFQNEKIAERAGLKAWVEATNRGDSPETANKIESATAKQELARLNKWTGENVGLD